VLKGEGFDNGAWVAPTVFTCFAFGDVAQHIVTVREADQRAKVGAFIEQIARTDAA
jgi:hypothetical protein